MTDLITLSSGIDIHVHFREPGLDYKENMATGMNAAHAGGITTVIDMPNTIPPTNDEERLIRKLDMAKKYPGLLIAAGMTSTNVLNGQLAKLTQHTSIFKVFMANSTGNLAIDPTNLMKGIEILECNGNNLLMFHAEKPEYIKKRNENSDENDVRPVIAELEAISSILELAEDFTDINMHITHVSTLDGANILRKQKMVSWDVLPKYLDFSSDIVNNIGNYAKMNPPLRSNKDVVGLNDLLRKGEIPMISSDHAPHTREDKAGITAGAPGVQEIYHTMIDRYIRGEIKKKILNDILINNPSELLEKIDIKPILGEIVIDRDAFTHVNESFVQSKCGWSLWSGKKFAGRIIQYRY